MEYDDGDTRYHKYLNAEMQKGEVKIEEAVATATEAGVIDEEKEEKEAEEAGTAVEAEAAAHEAGPVEAGPVGAACAENREARRTELVMGVEVEVEVEDDDESDSEDEVEVEVEEAVVEDEDSRGADATADAPTVPLSSRTGTIAEISAPPLSPL